MNLRLLLNLALLGALVFVSNQLNAQTTQLLSTDFNDNQLPSELSYGFTHGSLLEHNTDDYSVQYEFWDDMVWFEQSLLTYNPSSQPSCDSLFVKADFMEGYWNFGGTQLYCSDNTFTVDKNEAYSTQDFFVTSWTQLSFSNVKNCEYKPQSHNEVEVEFAFAGTPSTIISAYQHADYSVELNGIGHYGATLHDALTSACNELHPSDQSMAQQCVSDNMYTQSFYLGMDNLEINCKSDPINSITETNEGQKNLLFVTDMLGKPVSENYEGIILQHFDDGSTTRTIQSF